ncbi:MAG: nucleoside triphosphate pyrophosphohydrolase [Ginsengibacter sp.]
MQTNLDHDFNRLVKIMDDLREKCPWDRKQTVATLRQLTIEETFELADAITDKDWKGIKEELGDILLHIIFYARIAQEEQKFTLQEVISNICEKLVRRHPHIYSDVKVENEGDVKRNWENLKLKEGKASVLSGVPRSLPATVKAMRLQEKAKQVGFEWHTKEAVWEKILEEQQELSVAVSEADQSHIEEEIGDVLFSIINYARFVNVDAENALELTNKKFINRFSKMEEVALKNHKHLSDMSLEEMDELWNIIKNQNR